MINVNLSDFIYSDLTPDQIIELGGVPGPQGPQGPTGPQGPAGSGDMNKSVYDTNDDGTVDNADTVNGFTVGANVPADAKFTDTVTTINGKTGAIAKADITALGIPAQDTVYSHPATHSADMITDGANNKVFTTAEQYKLNRIENEANKYVHPGTHSADIIVDGSTNKAYTSAEKTKLAGIQTGANNYVHPDTHSAQMIVEDVNHRFVTDLQMGIWDTSVVNEPLRIQAEENRVTAENSRVTAENARKVWEAYDNGKAYVIGNKVYYNGSSYYCINASTGNLPTDTTFWQQIASSQTTANNISVSDPSNYFTATNVEDALLEIANIVSTNKAEVDAQLAEKANLSPMYFDDSLGEYVNVENYWNAQKTGKIYTTEFYQYSISPSSLGTAKDDNIGLIAEPSTNTIAGRDDYTSIGLFRPVDVNGYVDGNDDYHITAIKGDGRFKADGTNGDVWVMNMTGYVKRYDTDTVWGYSYSDVMHGGFDVIPGGRKIDGTIRPYMLRAKYPAVRNPYDGNKLASISGQNPEYNNMSHNGQITAFLSKGSQYSGKTSHDDFWVKLMLMLKYKSTDTETLARGCISYYSQYTPSVYESGVSRFIVTNAQAVNFVIGSRVSVGDFSSGTQTADRQSALVNNIANRVKVLSKETLPDGLNTAINLDCTPFTTSATTTISTMVWGSGACDDVMGVDGSPYDVKSGKEPLIINGIEVVHGGYEVVQNLIIYSDNTDPLDYQIKAYICYDCKKYATSPTQDYSLIAKRLVQTNNSWKYMSKGEIDISHPSVIVPTEANAGSTTGFADGIYTNSPTTGYRVWLSFGHLADGALGGFFFLRGGIGLTVSYWYVLGRLSATGRSWG